MYLTACIWGCEQLWLCGQNQITFFFIIDVILSVAIYFSSSSHADMAMWKWNQWKRNDEGQRRDPFYSHFSIPSENGTWRLFFSLHTCNAGPKGIWEPACLWGIYFILHQQHIIFHECLEINIMLGDPDLHKIRHRLIILVFVT